MFQDPSTMRREIWRALCWWAGHCETSTDMRAKTFAQITFYDHTGHVIYSTLPSPRISHLNWRRRPSHSRISKHGRVFPVNAILKWRTSPLLRSWVPGKCAEIGNWASWVLRSARTLSSSLPPARAGGSFSWLHRQTSSSSWWEFSWRTRSRVLCSNLCRLR